MTTATYRERLLPIRPNLPPDVRDMIDAAASTGDTGRVIDGLDEAARRLRLALETVEATADALFDGWCAEG